MFILTSCIYLFGCITFLAFSSGVVQPWAIIKDETEKEKEEFEVGSNEKKTEL